MKRSNFCRAVNNPSGGRNKLRPYTNCPADRKANTFVSPPLFLGEGLGVGACPRRWALGRRPHSEGIYSIAIHFIVVLVLCLSLACLGARTTETAANGLPPGHIAPAFTLPDIQGRQVSLEAYKGKIVVLNFWAFWCDTWKAELPHLKTLAMRQDEVGFRLLAVSVDGTRLKEFLSLTGGKVPFPVLLDVGGKVSASYKIGHVPTIVIVDGAGKVCFVKAGYPGNEAVLHEITRIAARVASPQQTSSFQASSMSPKSLRRDASPYIGTAGRSYRVRREGSGGTRHAHRAAAPPPDESRSPASKASSLPE